jgi:arylformamidase
MRLYDVTRTIRPGMPVYEGDPAVTIAPRLSVAQGDAVNVCLLTLGSHTGTHVDAPRHFRDGAPGVDALPLSALLGPARVVEVADDHIGAEVLAGLDLAATPRLLFKTRNSAPGQPNRFRRDYVALTGQAARMLVDAGVCLVGLDGPSADLFGAAECPAHRAFLDAGVVILEGLDLAAVPPGGYELLCLPLTSPAGAGAPARVLLRTPD